MSDEFRKRLQQASKNFSEKNKADEQAHRDREELRKNFLLSFWEKGNSVIDSVLRDAEEDIEGANISWSDNEDRIMFTFAPGTKYAVLAFIADPLKMRVRLHSAIGSVMNSKDVDRFQDLQEGSGKLASTIAELTLDQIEKSIIEKYVVEFVEQAFGR